MLVERFAGEVFMAETDPSFEHQCFIFVYFMMI